MGVGVGAIFHPNTIPQAKLEAEEPEQEQSRVNISDEDVAFWSSKGVLPSLTIDQIRDVARVFVNGKLAGSKVGKWVSFNQRVQLDEGVNELILLSEIVGLQNYGAFLEKDGAGFRGQVKLTGLSKGEMDLTDSLWTYQVGLKGESSMIYSPEKQECAEWSGMQKDDIQSPFTWYKTMFDAPEGTDPVAIGLGSMGKGQAWVNGRHIGRYWSLVAPESGCPSSCNYAGAYSDSKCRSNCGMPTQSWYHIPREWLQESGDCQNFSVGKCHASNTQDVVTEACAGKDKCAISVTNDVFGDPCPRVVKDLAVEAECSAPSATKELRDNM
ncbi:hypothetical protein PR202_gb00065 [Eleusine coracana subsp. coracana]|uniref:SUEL-type lectin domain-containing protein n=1 Tax=Eleusine coracana subsp. coracana TaxID=191504 RepID=A0AAV5DT88_ELECO|nr:hypothetical protein PR202_gb00065 [Eleusine coracana subsp. coracana]